TERRVTILLADLRGFTAMSATQPARTVITMLNRCLTRMSEVVYRYQGTIDKFMGDAIMVLFGAPVRRDDDVARALACAIEMQISMRELNARYHRIGLPELHLGIGINTGTVMAGRFGGDVYSEYTVIGDEVNLASRIEAFSLRGQVLISESTWRACASEIVATDSMEVYVKGKGEPVRLRELIAIPALNLKVPRQDFRRSHRVEVKLPCTVRQVSGKIVLPHAIKASIRDLGYHGLLLSLDRALAVHTEVKLEFDLMLVDYRANDIYAKVVSATRSGSRWLVGLEFTSIPAETDSKIQMFVQMLVAGQ
ncbi:MAG: adenylate/guanylate cyclase domain-containing protein, partial [Burkholderiales bacterium]